MRIALWVKLSYSLMALIVLPIYWLRYEPEHFLWFSDIALIVMIYALWRESKLATSTMAVGVLALEFVWLLDFISGGNIIGLAKYMFEDELETHMKTLSLFHIPLLAVIIYALVKLGYDKRGLWAQIILSIIVLPLTYFWADPADENINWVFGPGSKPQQTLPPLQYLALLMLTLPVAVYLPTHLLLKKFFGKA
jgi:hypothetical protein